MKRTIFAATLMAGGLAAATAGALDNVSVKGSDRMESLMRDVLSACPAATANGISSGGGGATSGANTMIKRHPDGRPHGPRPERRRESAA